MNFEDLIQLPNIRSVLLCEITAAVPVQDWVPYNDIWRAQVATGINLATLDADGVTVTAGADVAAVEATAGRWVQSGGYVYYNPAAGEPYAAVVIGRASFYFSDLPKAFTHYYESRIKSVPRLSLRIEPTFGGVAQVGGGKLSLHNEDGFFDSLPVRWDNGIAVLKLGLERPDEDMDYGDYETVGTWTLDGAGISDASFDLNLKERKNNLRAKIPAEKFTRADWPSIADDLVGKEIPTIYGRVFGVKPFIADPNALTLKVCSHAIAGFIGLRKQEDRERTDTRTPEWAKVVGEDYYRTAFTDTVERVEVATVELVEVVSFDALAATVGSYLAKDNFLYVNAAAVPTSANAEVDIRVSFTAWTEIPFATRDVVNGEFTVSPEHWDGEQDLSVDLVGYAVGGEALENVADIIEQILASVGETTINAASFATVREYFELGTDRHGNPFTHLKPSLVLDKPIEALKVLEELNALCGTFLFVNAGGEWNLGVAKPESEAALDLTTVELFNVSKETQTDEIFTSVEMIYAQRRQDGWNETLTESSERLRRFAGKDVHLVKQVEAALWDGSDARYVAQRLLSTQGQPVTLWKATVPRMGLTLQPGDKVRVRRSRGSLDELMEVLEIDYDLVAKQASLLLGDMRGWGRSSGFWTADGQAAWNPAWTAAEVKEQIVAAGFWTDDNGYADEGDARSRAVSRWW